MYKIIQGDVISSDTILGAPFESVLCRQEEGFWVIVAVRWSGKDWGKLSPGEQELLPRNICDSRFFKNFKNLTDSEAALLLFESSPRELK